MDTISTSNKVFMRRMNSAQASTTPACTATVRSNTTVSKKVPSINSR